MDKGIKRDKYIELYIFKPAKYNCLLSFRVFILQIRNFLQITKKIRIFFIKQIIEEDKV